MTVAFRPAEPRDHDFVIGAWETSYRLADTAGMVLAVNWATVMREQFAQVIARPYVRTVVAYETDDPDPGIADLLGFIVAEPDETPPLVYYAFVKENFRRSGIARRLFKAAGIDPAKQFHYACSTPWCLKLASKIPMGRWRPRRGRYSREHRRPA